MTTKFLLLPCFKHVYIRGLAEDILRDKVFLVSKKDFVTVSNTRITIRKHPLTLIKSNISIHITLAKFTECNLRIKECFDMFSSTLKHIAQAKN